MRAAALDTLGLHSLRLSRGLLQASEHVGGPQPLRSTLRLGRVIGRSMGLRLEMGTSLVDQRSEVFWRAKRGPRRAGRHLGPILREHLLWRPGQPCLRPLVHHLRHQLVDRLRVLAEEVTEHTVVDALDVAGDPPEGHVGLDPSRDLASVVDTAAQRVPPQCQHHARTVGPTACTPLNRLHVTSKGRQVDPSKDLPQQARRMLRWQKILGEVPDHALPLADRLSKAR